MSTAHESGSRNLGGYSVTYNASVMTNASVIRCHADVIHNKIDAERCKAITLFSLNVIEPSRRHKFQF